MSPPICVPTRFLRDIPDARPGAEAPSRNHHYRVLGAALLFAVTAPAIVSAQEAGAQRSPLLDDLAFLIGSWTGKIDGSVGSGTGQRQYRPIVRGRYLLMTHASYLFVEGYVSRADCELGADPWRLTCLDEAVESGPDLRFALDARGPGRKSLLGGLRNLRSGQAAAGQVR